MADYREGSGSTVPVETGYKIQKICVGNKQVRPDINISTTVVCDFRAWASGEKTTLNEMKVAGDFISYNDSGAVQNWDNWTLRLIIPSTDRAAEVLFGGGYNYNTAITNKWYSNGVTISDTSTWLRQNLIKKAYLKVTGWYISSAYPVFGAWWIYVCFSKKKVSSNVNNSNYSNAGFIFGRGNDSSFRSYKLYPVDQDLRYLVLPTTQNVQWNGSIASEYVDQWVSCMFSRLTLETRWTDPSNFHYWLIVEASWNEYDLWLCSDLWSAAIGVACNDWRMTWQYKEIGEAYLEMFDNYYIDRSWSITTTKPR